MIKAVDTPAVAAARTELQAAHAELGKLNRSFTGGEIKAAATARKNAANAAWNAARRAYYAEFGHSVA